MNVVVATSESSWDVKADVERTEKRVVERAHSFQEEMKNPHLNI